MAVTSVQHYMPLQHLWDQKNKGITSQSDPTSERMPMKAIFIFCVVIFLAIFWYLQFEVDILL